MIEAANGEKYAVVLVSSLLIKYNEGDYFQMDTQGTFDGSTATRHALNIFGLSTLLSSHQCYNLVEIIPTEAMEQLSLLMDYGKLYLTETQDFGKPFQVVWKLGNFSNKYISVPLVCSQGFQVPRRLYLRDRRRCKVSPTSSRDKC